jgi:hypothetical protein
MLLDQALEPPEWPLAPLLGPPTSRQMTIRIHMVTSRTDDIRRIRSSPARHAVHGASQSMIKMAK